MDSRTAATKESSIVIIGAGVFGLSHALELKQRGYSDVTVIDRNLPPVCDGSSVDISRIIRVEYSDAFYTRMAKEALQGWLSEYKDHYYRSGFVILAQSPGSEYIEKSKAVNDSRLDEYDDANEIRAVYPDVQARLDGLKAYHNPDGGWADAASAIRDLSIRCSLAGVSFITGERGTVVSLRQSCNRVTGVNVAKGDPISAEQVIVATGAWTNRLLPLSQAVSASGQPVGFIQLTPEEAACLEKTPVIINLSTGVFCFPPTPGTNILKVARHGYGFATTFADQKGADTISSPKLLENNVGSSFLPEDAEDALREGLQELLPAFAKHPWMNRRLCWYSDTPEGDFIVDHHPSIEGLFVSTGGSGQYAFCLNHLHMYLADLSTDSDPVHSNSCQCSADTSQTASKRKRLMMFARSGSCTSRATTQTPRKRAMVAAVDQDCVCSPLKSKLDSSMVYACLRLYPSLVLQCSEISGQSTLVGEDRCIIPHSLNVV